MQYECKITVLEKKCFTDYQEKYLADPKSGPCPFFNVGDEFIFFKLSLLIYHKLTNSFFNDIFTNTIIFRI